MNLKANIYGILSIVSVIVSFFMFGWLFAILGILFGIIGLVSFDNDYEKITPLIGLVVGSVILVLLLFFNGLIFTAFFS